MISKLISIDHIKTFIKYIDINNRNYLLKIMQSFKRNIYKDRKDKKNYNMIFKKIRGYWLDSEISLLVSTLSSLLKYPYHQFVSRFPE